MTLLATGAIIVATAVCCVTLAIQNTGHKLLQKQLRISSPDVIITTKTGFFCKDHVKFLGSSAIEAWAPVSWRYVFVAGRHQMELCVGMIKFVDPVREKSFLLQKIVYPDPVKSDHLLRGVVIGAVLQANLGVIVGDSIDITFLKEATRKKKRILKPASCSLIVTGVISTGIPEIDETLILCSYRIGRTFISNLYWDEIAVRMKQDEYGKQEVVIRAMQKKFPKLLVRSLKDLYPTFFASMSLEQHITWLYLSLLLFFVFITLAALFFMQAIYNQKKVIILNLLGMNSKTMCFFICFMIAIQAFVASFVGIFVAHCIGYLMMLYTPGEVQRLYNIVHLPIEFPNQLIITVMMIMMILAMLAGCFTFIFLSRYNTLQTLKSET